MSAVASPSCVLRFSKNALPEAVRVSHSVMSTMPEDVSDVGEPEESVQFVGEEMRSRLSARPSSISL